MARIYSVKRAKNLRYTLKKLFSYLGHYKGLLALVAILVIISDVCNIMGTYMIKPIVNSLLETGSWQSLVRGVIITGSIFACGAISALLYSQIMARLAQKVVFDIRNDLFAHIETLPLKYFDSHQSGDIMSYFTNDIDTISDALNNSFSSTIKSGVQITGTLIIVFVLNFSLSLIVLLSYIAMFLYIRYSGKRSKLYYSRQQKKLADLDGFVQEMIEGEKVIKVFNHESESIKDFDVRNKALEREGEKAQGYALTMIPAVVSISYFNYAIVALLGGFMTLRSMMDIGSLSTYLVFVRQTTGPINQFTQQSNFLLSSLAGCERIFEVMDEISEINEGKVSLVNVIKKDDGKMEETEKVTGCYAFKDGENLIELKGDVRFNNVSFSYDKKTKVLNDISLYAKPGEKIAFVGSTGAGKTTITNLINRFYDIDEGEITYDGIDIRRIEKSALRKTLSMVLQDTHLFSGTIRDNIRYACPDASEEDVVNAAKIANAHSFITRLPEGYDTMIHNDGANLSSGQRQLIAIARASILNPPVLILDEATSNIDTRTEDLIEKAMDRLMEGRTIFVIAHRLSTVRNSNAIMVLEHGRIIERGTHDDLLKYHGLYYNLYKGLFELE